MKEKKEIGFNTQCENYKNDLVNLINQSNLPISVIYYITKGIMAEVETTYYGVLNKEAEVQESTSATTDGGDE